LFKIVNEYMYDYDDIWEELIWPNTKFKTQYASNCQS
jgi:hypothetical protein